MSDKVRDYDPDNGDGKLIDPYLLESVTRFDDGPRNECTMYTRDNPLYIHSSRSGLRWRDRLCLRALHGSCHKLEKRTRFLRPSSTFESQPTNVPRQRPLEPKDPFCLFSRAGHREEVLKDQPRRLYLQSPTMNAASTKFRAGVVVQLLVLIMSSLLPFCYANPIPSGLTQAAPGASSMIPQPVSGQSPPPYHTPSHLAQGASVAARVPQSASNNPPLLSEHVEGDSPPPYQQVPDHDPLPLPHSLNEISRKFIVPIFVGDVSFQNDPRLQFRARDFTVSNSITFPDYPPDYRKRELAAS
ncbi:hypothetical protein EV361DRAFT_873669 [Lentinula raphanica]|nr:hypothetical protein EV361DRAFT_873669 [Lentinula raphanica]